MNEQKNFAQILKTNKYRFKTFTVQYSSDCLRSTVQLEFLKHYTSIICFVFGTLYAIAGKLIVH